MRPLFLFLLFSGGLFAQEEISGIVFDLKTGEPLPFVNVQIVGTTNGVPTDSAGFFLMHYQGGEYIRFSRVGYNTRVYSLSSFQNGTTIYLAESINALEELVISPGENPAWRIIRGMIRNKSFNDPMLFDRFSADLYNKVCLVNERIRNDSIATKGEDGNPAIILENKGKVYFKNGQRKEVIENTLSNVPKMFPINILFPNTMLPWGFYMPYYRFNPLNNLLGGTSVNSLNNERNYLGVVRENALNLYDFELVDTLITATDSLFHITFLPKIKSTFDALKGEMWVSSDGFALKEIQVENADENLESHFRISQEFTKTMEGWVPKSTSMQVTYLLKTKKLAEKISISNLQYYTNPSKGKIPKNVLFDGATKEVAIRADTITADQFEKIRPVPLSLKEQDLYIPEKSVLASLPGLQKTLQKAEWPSKIIAQKGLAAGPIILGLDQSYMNEHEFLRLGLTAQNNLNLQPWYDLRGYVAYGLKDAAFKYGAEANVLLSKNRFNKLGVYVQQDLLQPGTTAFLRPNYVKQNYPILPFSGEGYRADAFTKRGVQMYVRPFPFLWTRFFVEQEERSPITYLNPINESILSESFRSVGVQMRYAHKENLTRVGLIEYVSQNYFPIVRLNAQRSRNIGSNTDFWLAEVELTQQFRWKRLGFDLITVNAGMVQGEVPYTYLLNIFNTNRSVFFNQFNGFQAGDFSEIGLNDYLSVYYVHNFGRNLFKFSQSWFTPEPYVGHRWAVGRLRQDVGAANIRDFGMAQREVGLGFNNLLVVKILRLPLALHTHLTYNYTPEFFGQNRFRIRPALGLRLN